MGAVAGAAGRLLARARHGGACGARRRGTLAHYVAIVVAACTDVTLPVYQVVVVAAAMITATEGPLGVPMPVRNLVLPMAVSIFRITSAAANFAVAIYLAALHGITIGLGLFLVGMLVATVVSLAAVGLPSQVSFFTTIGPVCLAIGVTVELLPLLLAVKTIPDIFRTVGNVTADVALTTLPASRA